MLAAAGRSEALDIQATARVESIAAGGAGVVRLDRRVVFVPRAVPGDRVRFRVISDRGKFLLGELEAVEEASPHRREPPCPHWEGCGGCPLQMAAPEAQLEAKRRIFLDALQRIGKLELPVPLREILPGGPEFHYRARARFQVRGEEIGFFAPGTRRLQPIEDCLLVERPVARALAGVRRFLKAEPGARRVDAVEITSLGPDPEEGAGLQVFPPGSREGFPARDLPRAVRSLWVTFARDSGFRLNFWGERKPGEPPAWTARHLPEPDAACVLRISPESFLQPSRAANQALVKTLLDEARVRPGGRLVDLFCGAGNLTLPFARRGVRAVGVESNPFAVQDAIASARDNAREAAGGAPPLFLLREAGRAEAGEIRGALGGGPEVLLLDPPRKGALEAVPLILALEPRQILYVSCNPATFARDARALHEGGYRIDGAHIVPMFPNTAHVETLTSWSRAPGAAPEGEDSSWPPSEGC
ncbi:MAG: class I SAM-dependent RNA methyltransferase [Candidatus Tectomicrobia bacterium]|uniref:Class I SAM-dependent RNA methyltransferase n=1 Tax=Tectimicrobiota bacterium TaxID=2528274 RepID=A0A932HYL4_UNCTE|nr:class I SAM-dependent RNA methyltransferase [Candidatus Tectomicrobia bacterium]